MVTAPTPEQLSATAGNASGGTGHARQQSSPPAVSVLITLYNYAAYIETCLDSVRASKRESLPGDIEVIVVDDASTDGSVQAVESYMATRNLPIRLIKNEVNRGLADTRNIGLRAAAAPFVFILDADNVIRPECLAAHYHALAEADCAVAYGHINRFDHHTRKSLGLMSHHPWQVRELVLRPYIDAMAMVKKDAVLRVGGFSTEYGAWLPQGWEDYDLWLKLAQAGYSGVMIPQVLSDYRVHDASMLQKTMPFQRDLATYFTRKFHALTQLHPDTPLLFGTSRRELAISCEPSALLMPVARPRKSRWLHRLLGQKLCRSLCKRLAYLHGWIEP